MSKEIDQSQFSDVNTQAEGTEIKNPIPESFLAKLPRILRIGRTITAEAHPVVDPTQTSKKRAAAAETIRKTKTVPKKQEINLALDEVFSSEELDESITQMPASGNVTFEFSSQETAVDEKQANPFRIQNLHSNEVCASTEQYKSMIEGLAEPEIIDIFIEEQNKINSTIVSEPAHYGNFIASNPKKDSFPIEDDYSNNSRP